MFLTFMFGTLYGPYRIFTVFAPGWVLSLGSNSINLEVAPGGSGTFPPVAFLC